VRIRVERLRRCKAELERISPAQQLARRHEGLAEKAGRLERAARHRLVQAVSELEQRRRQILALSPDSVLQRGYSIPHDAETGPVPRASDGPSPGQPLP